MVLSAFQMVFKMRIYSVGERRRVHQQVLDQQTARSFAGGKKLDQDYVFHFGPPQCVPWKT
jgi:hypothetical protein